MIEIRKIKREDVPFLNEVRNCYAEEHLHDSRKFTLEETFCWFDLTNPDFRIVLLNNIPIGYFRLSNHCKINKNIYIGMDIHKDFKGRGYGFKSYIEFIPKLLKEYDLNKISLEVLSTNIVAINLYKKLGFVHEGIKRKEVFKKGEFVDSIIMSMLKEEIINNKIYEL